MAVQVSYPGVYIEEFTPGAPIEGVGTSTAAFVGVAAKGDIDRPTKLTTWDQFRDRFGEQPVPGFYLWDAARGFFQNGGQVCYVVRASNGAHMSVTLNDGAGKPVFRVRARQPGATPTVPPIALDVKRTSILPAPNFTEVEVYRPTAAYTVNPTLRELTLASAAAAAQFRPADWVHLGPGNERVQVARVNGAIVRLATEFAGALLDTGVIRLADSKTGDRVFRLGPSNAITPVDPDALGPGAILSIQQGSTAHRTVETVQAEPLATVPPITTYRVTFREGLPTGLSLDPGNPDTPMVWSNELDIEVTQGTSSTVYAGLGMDPAHPRYVLTAMASDPVVVLEPVEPPPGTALPENFPANFAGPLAGGLDENLTTILDQDFIDALDTLRRIDDVNLIAVPDCLRLAPSQGSAQTVQQALITHCEQMADRFAVLDSLPALPLFGSDSIETQRAGLDSPGGYAALYYPWLRVRPVGPGAPILVPPSGHVCGIIARTDTTRGVHKAPANEIVNGALGVETTMSDVEQGQLNLAGINVIRVFQTGGRPVLWGARTTATKVNNSWMYVNVRRLFLFCEESIVEGIRWAVFEPNNPGLWQKLRRSITEFLTRVWRDGALFGVKPEEAFYVRIDEALNPDSERALGRLHIEIGLRPSYPAEFIIVRIGIWQGGSEVTEL
jgi:phage tail sheath protein FI